MLKINKNCPICGNRVLDKPLDKYFFERNNINYQLFKCNFCGLEFWEPLEIIKEFYENEIFEAYALFHHGARSLYSNHLMFFKYFPLKGG
ncbi:MAG: hypothetical protein KatS3mg093_007 [Candidatus Parcubacteria bacterium]|nr:MAG: hypothetical protein KatS3mg093_007 [Candidatus Parcubacteria bacterium]